MKFVIVADEPGAWCSPPSAGIALVDAQTYVTHPAWRVARGVKLVNLCRNCGYQRWGYYVSLLGEARGHRPTPQVGALRDLGPMRPARCAVAAAQRCWDARQARTAPAGAFALALLRDPQAGCSASNDEAVEKFIAAGRAYGIRVEVLGRDDIGRLAEMDALFIRDNTFIRHYTYRFSRRARTLGLALVDDPESMLRCNNKVFLAELLPACGIPIPRTLAVHRGNVEIAALSCGLPCVLKRPDSSLSLGVARVESEAELRAVALQMLEESDLIVAQEYLPTAFDWRVGILEGRALFVCKYHMVPDHWQIVRHAPGRGYEEGTTEALPLDRTPRAVLDLATRAANLMGDGFYGVDIKEVAPDDFRVIEVNDNPNVDAGNEDGVLGEALYFSVMEAFARRMTARRRSPP